MSKDLAGPYCLTEGSGSLGVALFPSSTDLPHQAAM
ncbi:rCG22314 [Rattus norvegicus]|uniref:RCG22314 n=1 Tax=Rattus norvegicus TaxID=10116 RepID=A6INP8_RAT|nr:rCG22314 [Rattus norvegicus]